MIFILAKFRVIHTQANSGVGGNLVRRLSRSESVPNVSKSSSSGSSRRAPRGRTVSVSHCFEEGYFDAMYLEEALFDIFFLCFHLMGLYFEACFYFRFLSFNFLSFLPFLSFPFFISFPFFTSSFHPPFFLSFSSSSIFYLPV